MQSAIFYFGRRFRATCLVSDKEVLENRGSPPQADLSSRTHFGNVWRHLWMSQLDLGVGGAAGIWGVKAKDVANILQCTGQLPQKRVT